MNNFHLPLVIDKEEWFPWVQQGLKKAYPEIEGVRVRASFGVRNELILVEAPNDDSTADRSDEREDHDSGGSTR